MNNINLLNAIRNNIANSMTSSIFAISKVGAAGINVNNHTGSFNDVNVSQQQELGIVCDQFVCGSDEQPTYNKCK